MADHRRAIIRLSAGELEMVLLAVTSGWMDLTSGDQMSMRQKRDLERAMSKLLDAENRFNNNVESGE